MSVRKNIGYPLKARKIRTPESRSWVAETAAMVDCQNLLDRHPAQLSGGQQQRVALARGLVARPDVVLFDEPLSNLDARLRDLVRAQLHELHERLHFTAIFVTHDQSEALALADRIVIMRAGRFEQIATAEEVFERPATEYVAGFIGMGNRFELTRDDSGGWVCFGQQVAGIPPVGGDQREVIVRMRGDDVAVAPTAEQLPAGALRVWGTFVDSQFGGRHIDVVIDIEGQRVHTRAPVDAFGGWARRMHGGDRIAVGFGHAGSVWFTGSDERIDNPAPALAARQFERVSS
jgi:iron(III) transport system ATP-binding protein